MNGLRVTALIVLSSLWSPIAVQAQQRSDVLQLDDRSANRLLGEMVERGNLDTREHAEAWIVVATIALGMGLEKCGFSKPGNGSIFFEPALDTMSPDQVKVLNRLVTSNFRRAETPDFVDLDSVYPITRQTILFVSDDGPNWNCEKIGGVWEAAANYSSRPRE